MALEKIGGFLGAVKKVWETASRTATEKAKGAVEWFEPVAAASKEVIVSAIERITPITEETLTRIGEMVREEGWIEEMPVPLPYEPLEDRLWGVCKSIADKTGKDALEFYEKSVDIRRLGRDEIIPKELFTTTSDKLHHKYRGIFWISYTDPETGQIKEHAIYGGEDVLKSPGDYEDTLIEKLEAGEYPEFGTDFVIEMIGIEVMA